MSYDSQLTLGARIAGGQHGDVYEGKDQVHGKVAVKVLRQKPGESTADWAARSAALLQEAQHLKAASHPNIVQVHNLVRHTANDVLHLVTEFCDGGSIDAIYQNGPLTPSATSSASSAIPATGTVTQPASTASTT